MPYLKWEDRLDYDEYPETPGQLNYAIHGEITEYLRVAGINYETLNTVLGVLEAVKQEFYRRKVTPYEDNKIKENGDISLYENG